jgi:hypothetical protein
MDELFLEWVSKNLDIIDSFKEGGYFDEELTERVDDALMNLFLQDKLPPQIQFQKKPLGPQKEGLR